MNSVSFGQSIPGIRSDRTYTPRIVLWTEEGANYLPAGKVIDGSQSRDPLNGTIDIITLRPGTLMGKITATGKYRPMIVGKSTGAYTSGDTTIAVSAATATEVSRLKTVGGGGNLSLKLIGPPTAAGTVAATVVTCSGVTINGASSSLTVTNLGLNKVTDSLITLADGSDTPLGILNDFVRVTDIDGNNLDCQLSRLLIGGKVYAAQILNWPGDASTIAWLKGLLNAPATGCGPFIFDSNF